MIRIITAENIILQFMNGDLFVQWTDMNKMDMNALNKDGEIIQ